MLVKVAKKVQDKLANMTPPFSEKEIIEYFNNHIGES